MTTWRLQQILADLHAEVELKLHISSRSLGHPVSKGTASEGAWLKLLSDYLPQRYQAESAFVVDSLGAVSDQIDVVIFDRQYSPFIFSFDGQKVIPAESVYAVMEVKQTISAEHVRYAQSKVASVRRLQRTSLAIPHAGGTYPPKPLIPICGGLLTLESVWNPPMGTPLMEALCIGDSAGRLDMGCVAVHGTFDLDPETGCYRTRAGGKPATSFLFDLIARLQMSGTVPMIDVRAYAAWLDRT